MVQEQVLDRFGIEPGVPSACSIRRTIRSTGVRMALHRRLQRLGGRELAREGREATEFDHWPPRSPRCAREVDRLGSDPRFVQVILPAVAHHVFGRPYNWPIFEAAERTASSSPCTRAVGRGRPWSCPLVHRVAHGYQPGMAEPGHKPRSRTASSTVRGAEGRHGRVELDVGPAPHVALRLQLPRA